jgi:hypothetical protein
MTTMWTPAPQRDVLRQQEYRRWVLTSEPRKKAPTPAPVLGPVDWERAARDSWQRAWRALDTWAPAQEHLVTGCPSARRLRSRVLS